VAVLVKSLTVGAALSPAATAEQGSPFTLYP
jgi:hypothetical protein